MYGFSTAKIINFITFAMVDNHIFANMKIVFPILGVDYLQTSYEIVLSGIAKLIKKINSAMDAYLYTSKHLF